MVDGLSRIIAVTACLCLQRYAVRAKAAAVAYINVCRTKGPRLSTAAMNRTRADRHACPDFVLDLAFIFCRNADALACYAAGSSLAQLYAGGQTILALEHQTACADAFNVDSQPLIIQLHLIICAQRGLIRRRNCRFVDFQLVRTAVRNIGNGVAVGLEAKAALSHIMLDIALRQRADVHAAALDYRIIKLHALLLAEPCAVACHRHRRSCDCCLTDIAVDIVRAMCRSLHCLLSLQRAALDIYANLAVCAALVELHLCHGISRQRVERRIRTLKAVAGYALNIRHVLLIHAVGSLRIRCIGIVALLIFVPHLIGIGILQLAAQIRIHQVHAHGQTTNCCANELRICCAPFVSSHLNIIGIKLAAVHRRRCLRVDVGYAHAYRYACQRSSAVDNVRKFVADLIVRRNVDITEGILAVAKLRIRY